MIVIPLILKLITTVATNYVDVDGDSNTINFDADGADGGYFYLDQTGNSRTFNIQQQSTLASDWLQINSTGTGGTVCVIQNDGGTLGLLII